MRACGSAWRWWAWTRRSTATRAQLSGGQKQRVAIARALAPRPQVLLCDEPTSALDAETTRSLLETLRDINHKIGVTIVIVTHELPVVELLCRHVAVLEQGQLIEQFAVAAQNDGRASVLGRELDALVRRRERDALFDAALPPAGTPRVQAPDALRRAGDVGVAYV